MQATDVRDEGRGMKDESEFFFSSFIPLSPAPAGSLNNTAVRE
jgi:hypothetical protein